MGGASITAAAVSSFATRVGSGRLAYRRSGLVGSGFCRIGGCLAATGERQDRQTDRGEPKARHRVLLAESGPRPETHPALLRLRKALPYSGARYRADAMPIRGSLDPS